MIESGFGRTDRRQLRELDRRSGPHAEPCHGDVREPRTPFRPVDAEALQALGQAGLEQTGASFLVVEHEHGHSFGLAIARASEYRPADPGSGLAECGLKLIELVCGPGAEKRQRDMEVLRRRRPDAGQGSERPAGPPGEQFRLVGRKWEAEEQAEAVMPAEASSGTHARGAPDRDRTRRM
jgi:hypothetical protein